MLAAVIQPGQATPRTGQDRFNQQDSSSSPVIRTQRNRRVRRGDGPAHIHTGTVRKIIIKNRHHRS
jgi:hypothetical protein